MSFRMNEAKILILLSVLSTHSCLGSENFVEADMAKSYSRISNEPTTSIAPPTTCHLVWKVTATSPPTKSHTPGKVDHGIIMDAVHLTMMDYEYRQMWMSLIVQNYTLFLHELKVQGPRIFIKPRHTKKKKYEELFEGTEGARRWQFLIDYMASMDHPQFERLLELFDYERYKYERITFTTFASPPLPTGYWAGTDPSYWQHFTERKDDVMDDPWKYTMAKDQWQKMFSLDSGAFTDIFPKAKS